MRFADIGQQLRAYRIESGLRAEEIAARLGVSRAALYRYEKGEVIKLDTVQRMAEMLNISPLSLLGIGMEYYQKPIVYFDRIRQSEESAEQIVMINVALCYLVCSNRYDSALMEALDEAADAPGIDRVTFLLAAEQLQSVQAARRKMQATRRPGIICLLSAARVRDLLAHGIGDSLAVAPTTRRLCRQVAAEEISHIAALMDAEPMGLQFGLLASGTLAGSWEILRARDRDTVAINPFLPDVAPIGTSGLAMVTVAEEAIATHQRMAEALWRDAAKGAAGAARLRQLLADAPPL